MIKLYICCLVLIIGSVEVGLDMDMKFHQVVMKIVSYDSSIKVGEQFVNMERIVTKCGASGGNYCHMLSHRFSHEAQCHLILD